MRRRTSKGTSSNSKGRVSLRKVTYRCPFRGGHQIWSNKTVSNKAGPHVDRESMLETEAMNFMGVFLFTAVHVVGIEDSYAGECCFVSEQNAFKKLFISLTLHQAPPCKVDPWGCSQREAGLELFENDKDINSCHGEQAKQSCDFVFLSHVLQLWYLHEAYHGSIAARHPQ